MSVWGIAALAALVLGSAAQPAAAAPRLVPCGNGALCGSVSVPLDRTGATPGRIRIHFELYRRTDRSRPALGTLLAAEGGPGYSTTDSRSYYLELFRPLRDRRDVLLVDQRGTGLSGAIRCPAAQSYVVNSRRAAELCGSSLGDRSDLYTTANATGDTAAVLDALGIGRISLYGDSYGSYFVQAFSLNHPDRVNRIVLDGTYPVTGADPWYPTTEHSILRVLATVCARSAETCPVRPDEMRGVLARLLEQVRAKPIAGRAPDGYGVEARAVVNPDTLATTLLAGDVVPAVLREFPAAAIAALSGRPRPLLRLVGEETTYYSGGPVRSYSEGAYLAYACSDYPQLWNVFAPFDVRFDQFRAAQARLPSDRFAPWTVREWANTTFMDYDYCLRWPAPDHPTPPVTPGAAYPDVPVLVVNGDLDLRTDLPQARQVARNFPQARFVRIPNAGHVTSLYDADTCSAALVRRFLATGRAGSQECTARIPEHRVVSGYPARTADALQASVAGASDRSTAADRRAARVAAEAVADVIDRWYAIAGYTGVGLRGGTFAITTTSRVPFPRNVWTIKLDHNRFTSDLAVTGGGTVPRGAGTAHVSLRLSGVATGRVQLRWQTRRVRAHVRITGTINGRTIDLRAPAPSFW
jgi:pimeloyl-ACP methyl ester carboxylesterase